jgi:hypothetical protein
MAAVPELGVNHQRKIGIGSVSQKETEARINRNYNAAFVYFRQQGQNPVQTRPGCGKKNGQGVVTRRNTFKPGNAGHIPNGAHVAGKVAYPPSAELFFRGSVNVIPH